MSGWSIVYLYNEVIISRKNIVFLSMKVDFVYASSAEPDEMPHNWHFSLDQVLTQNSDFSKSNEGRHFEYFTNFVNFEKPTKFPNFIANCRSTDFFSKSSIFYRLTNKNTN